MRSSAIGRKALKRVTVRRFLFICFVTDQCDDDAAEILKEDKGGNLLRLYEQQMRI